MSMRLMVMCMCLVTAAGAVPAAAERSTISSLITQYYPRGSLERGEEGIVEFAIEADRETRIESCIVTKSSGFRLLDAATCDLLVVHADLSPAVSQGQRVATTKTGRLVWKLPDAYRNNAKLAPQRATVTAGELDAQRLTCRRINAEGSIVKLKTHCLTRSQWSEAEGAARRQGQDMINPRQAEHGCPPHLRC